MKGIGPIMVAVIVGIVLIFAEAFIAHNLFIKLELLRRVGMEQEFIHALNRMEFFKRFVKPILNFSYCESKDLGEFKDSFSNYVRIYGIDVENLKAEVSGNKLKVDAELILKGSFFTIKDIVKEELEPSC